MLSSLPDDFKSEHFEWIWIKLLMRAKAVAYFTGFSLLEAWNHVLNKSRINGFILASDDQH